MGQFHRCTESSRRSFRVATPTTRIAADASARLSVKLATKHIAHGAAEALTEGLDWLAFWAIRRRGEFDYELDLMGKIVRWAIVVLALFLVQIPGPKLATFRVIVGCVGMAFLVWPNFAYHLTNILKQIFGRKINDDPKELF